MTCRAFRTAVLEGRADADHAAACAPCREFARRAAAVDAGLARSAGAAARAALPSGVRGRILAATARPARPEGRGRLLDAALAFAARAAAVAALLLAAWWAFPDDAAFALPEVPPIAAGMDAPVELTLPSAFREPAGGAVADAVRGLSSRFAGSVPFPSWDVGAVTGALPALPVGGAADLPEPPGIAVPGALLAAAAVCFLLFRKRVEP